MMAAQETPTAHAVSFVFHNTTMSLFNRVLCYMFVQEMYKENVRRQVERAADRIRDVSV